MPSVPRGTVLSLQRPSYCLLRMLLGERRLDSLVAVTCDECGANNNDGTHGCDERLQDGYVFQWSESVCVYECAYRSRDAQRVLDDQIASERMRGAVGQATDALRDLAEATQLTTEQVDAYRRALAAHDASVKKRTPPPDPPTRKIVL